MEIIKESYVEETVYYTLDFDIKNEPHCGFTFDCDENGKVNTDKLYEPAKINYDYCMNHKDDYNVLIRKHIDHYRHGDTGRCICGEVFELEDQYMGACECPKCGQWYNLFGQELKNPEYWEEEY